MSCTTPSKLIFIYPENRRRWTVTDIGHCQQTNTSKRINNCYSAKHRRFTSMTITTTPFQWQARCFRTSSSSEPDTHTGQLHRRTLRLQQVGNSNLAPCSGSRDRKHTGHHKTRGGFAGTSRFPGLRALTHLRACAQAHGHVHIHRQAHVYLYPDRP